MSMRRARWPHAAELAERAGTTQSVISAYEHDRRQPALSTPMDPVFATGLELQIHIRPQSRPIERLPGPIGRRVRRRLARVAADHGLAAHVANDLVPL